MQVYSITGYAVAENKYNVVVTCHFIKMHNVEDSMDPSIMRKIEFPFVSSDETGKISFYGTNFASRFAMHVIRSLNNAVPYVCTEHAVFFCLCESTKCLCLLC